jgi:glucan-binding YG repeat protein
MNKNLKKTIAITLIVSAFSVIAPAKSVNLLVTKAYAAASNDRKYLDSLALLTSSGSNIKLYESKDYKTNERVASEDVEAGETYYAETSSGTISIEIDGPSSKYVRVFKGTSDSSKGKKVSDDISLTRDSSTTIVVKVYGEGTNDKIRYEDDNDYNLLSTYKIKVECTGSDEDTHTEDSNDYDNIYLEKLSVDGQNISLSRQKIKYTYEVPIDTNEVTIKATPKDDDYSVTIDDDYVDIDDKYKKTVDLHKGENEFEIEVQDKDDSVRVYTLVINRGTTSTSTGTIETSDNTDASKIKTNQWVQIDGKWQYNDATGKTVKNSWIQNYFLQADGNMAVGWTSINGSWYYFGTDGAKKTGWQSVGESWYYLDSQGAMQTGWIKDLNGKYYYLNSNGSMAYNTKISGYKLAENGAWVK